MCTNKLSSSSKFRVEDGLTRSFIVVFFANFDCQVSFNGNFMKNFIILNIIIFADMVNREGWCFMGCEESFITIKLPLRLA